MDIIAPFATFVYTCHVVLYQSGDLAPFTFAQLFEMDKAKYTGNTASPAFQEDGWYEIGK